MPTHLDATQHIDFGSVGTDAVYRPGASIRAFTATNATGASRIDVVASTVRSVGALQVQGTMLASFCGAEPG